MSGAIESIVSKCIQEGYVDDENALWLRYALEKRCTAIIVGVPFWLIGILISSMQCATFFLISFSCLRVRTSGLHIDSVWKCCCMSIVTELLFLGVLPKLINKAGIIVLLVVSIIIIFKYAPYHCHKMHLSDSEIYACSISAKIRATIICMVVFALYHFQQNKMALGLALGMILVSTLLAFAYILEKRV